jgi:hypothetical protein
MSDTLKALDWETLVCFTNGLIEVAKVDGINPKEREYIQEFFYEEISHIPDKKDEKFENIADLPFDLENAKQIINDDEIKQFFLKSCVMLACVDTFTDDEKNLIKKFAEALDYSENKLNVVIQEVQDEIMAQFKDISIYMDSLKEVAQSIGVEEF